MKKIVIDSYTSSWASALRPEAPSVGQKVFISEQPDGREYSDFKAVMVKAGLKLDFLKYHPRLKMDEFIIKVGEF